MSLRICVVTRRFYAIVALLCLLATGCGYRFMPAGEKIYADVKTIHVGIFSNNTSEANIETTFRNAFIDRIISSRRFKVVNREEAADALLKGDIKSLVTSPLAYGGGNFSVEERISVNMSVSLRMRDSGKTVWSDENFSQWGDYASGGKPLAAVGSQSEALSKLAKDAAERAYRLMVSDF